MYRNKIIWGLLKNHRLKLREKINLENRDKLHNREISLISSNCNGAFLLHDLGLKFCSPTVNLWMEPADYLEFLRHLDIYLTADIIFDSKMEEERGYPVGLLNGKVKVYFQHYRNCDEARTKWQERAKRVNMEHLFIMFTDRDGCTYEQIKEFDRLPYKNKVIFTHIPYPEFQSAFYIKGFEKCNSVGLCFDFKSAFSGEKYYDDFPYIEWFNQEKPL